MLTDLKNKVTSVERMTSKRDGRALPFCKVQIRHQNAKNIFKLNMSARQLHNVVKVESARTTKEAVQCFNFNLFHHYARECSFPSEWCKCSGNHQSSECTTVNKKNPEQKPKCKCLLDPVISYRGCKAFPLKLQFTKKKSFAKALKGKSN